MSDLADKLRDAIVAITPLLGNPEAAHMAKPYQMLLGGLVLPALAEDDPKGFDAMDDTLKALVDAYTKEKVEAFFNPEPIEIEAEAPAPQMIEVEKPVEVIVEKVIKVPIDGAKHRRLKDTVKKESRKKRTLKAEDRDVFIRWVNANQKIVDKDSPVCGDLANLCSGQPSPLNASQVAGALSRLFDASRGKDFNGYINARMKKGHFTVRPEFTTDLLNAIEKNYEEARKDEAERAKAHAAMRAARTGGASTQQPTPVTQPVATPPAPSTATPVTSNDEEPEIGY